MPALTPSLKSILYSPSAATPRESRTIKELQRESSSVQFGSPLSLSLQMGSCRRRCCAGYLLALFLFSAVPLSVIFFLEQTKHSSETIEYRSQGWIRECAKWDGERNRFLVSTFLDGGVSQIPISDRTEQPAIRDPAVSGNASVGILVDAPRSRLLVVYSDFLRHKYNALAAYDLSSFSRLFLTQLSGPDDEPSEADDVAVDEEGNAYVTDVKSNKIWKVGAEGKLLKVIRSEVFTQRKSFLRNLLGLNGVVYHPSGFLLVVHTAGGDLFRVNLSTETVEIVEISGGSLVLGDGLELISPTKLVVAGTPSGRIVESSDGWRTAVVSGIYKGPMHRVASSATIKDGKVFLNHLIGGGLWERTHLITEAIFSPSKAKNH